MSERYAASAARPDYSHRYHVGNVGDVWKHLVWRSLVRALQLDPRPLDIVDCHAGHGEYALASTGEWTAGIGRLLAAAVTDRSNHVRAYLDFVRTFGMRSGRLERYPGSPIIVAELLRDSDSLRCFDVESGAHEDLTVVGSRYRFTALNEDGLSALSEIPAVSDARQQLYLIDPPWNVKSDWQTIPRAVSGAMTSNVSACIAIWYPIKSYTRVNTMLQSLRDAGLACLVADLITTPLDLRLNKLNGSGLCIINPPAPLATELGEIGPVLGAACATHAGFFEVRIRAWNRAAHSAPNPSTV